MAVRYQSVTRAQEQIGFKTPILTRTRTHLEILLEELDVFRVREKVSRLLALCRKILSFVHKFFRSIEHSNGPAHTRTGEIGL